MMEQEPKVAIIILNWNGFNDTSECLESIQKTTYQNYKVVLVDNGSKDSEGAKLKERFPHVQLISNPKNRGFAGGNNDGMRWAIENKFEYVVNLNNDCIVDEHWITHLVAGIRSAGVDFGTLRIMYYPEKELICSAGDALLIDGSGIAVNHLENTSCHTGSNRIFSACGAGSIYSVESLLDVELEKGEFFDELYFAYYEDVDLGVRLNARGRKGVLVPDAVIYHKGTQSAGFRSDFHRFQIERNRLLNMILNYPVWLIIAGECFYFPKLILRRIYRIFKTPLSREGRSEMPGIIEGIKIMMRARIWIIANFSLILRKRRMRKKKGFINSSILKCFYWDFSKTLNA